MPFSSEMEGRLNQHQEVLRARGLSAGDQESLTRVRAGAERLYDAHSAWKNADSHSRESMGNAFAAEKKAYNKLLRDELSNAQSEELKKGLKGFNKKFDEQVGHEEHKRDFDKAFSLDPNDPLSKKDEGELLAKILEQLFAVVARAIEAPIHAARVAAESKEHQRAVPQNQQSGSVELSGRDPVLDMQTKNAPTVTPARERADDGAPSTRERARTPRNENAGESPQVDSQRKPRGPGQ